MPRLARLPWRTKVAETRAAPGAVSRRVRARPQPVWRRACPQSRPVPWSRAPNRSTGYWAARWSSGRSCDSLWRLAAGISLARREVQAHDVVHRDVKPADVLVDLETGVVTLTGSGVATRPRRERQASAPPEVLAGTLA
jgi:hypothetical protein